ncbi:glutaminyl-peptide cyclotransferase [Paucibacter sp. APW11]|uniref:Glutaminyl-peptide cyclotransferase n=1 Tax=Roseateles aquae TaxID=3077235 RepID=A0ABU3PBZ5_9BURK|nr:glutaminyl-peptide cyclotransferase [Paucibacter sp. APW11]MDT9000089.1 glutaminyl-peptide cyclotransferase [Paucibacter sp. APW11]
MDARPIPSPALPWRRRLLAQALLLASLGPCVALAQRIAEPPVERVEVVRAYPHDPDAFTQGLIFLDGMLFESTGLNGRSSVRRVQLENGKVLQKLAVPPQYFAEGLTVWKDELILLTWQSRMGFVLDRRTMEVKRSFAYAGEGWGITHDDQQLYMSDGTATLRVLDPLSFKESRRISVTANGRPVEQLNELEWVEGEIWANVWQTDRIARIDPFSGRVLGWLDMSGLLASQGLPPDQADVLNGIAYDAQSKRIFVTGKLWPRLFEIRRKGVKR